MLSKGQKSIMYLCGILALLIGIITFIPYRTVPFLSTIDNIIGIELIVKLIVMPILSIGLSIYANVIKYEQIADCQGRSKVVNVMSYFPVVVYLASILVFLLHTLTFSPEPLGYGLWSVLFVILLSYLVFVIALFHRFAALVTRLEKVGTIILDSAIALMVVCFIISTWKITASYEAMYANTAEFFGKGDVFLFVIYLGAIVVFFLHCYALYKLIKKDQMEVLLNPSDFDINLDKLVKAEYNRAYNDIMDDFEVYFADHSEDYRVEMMDDEAFDDQVAEEVDAELAEADAVEADDQAMQDVAVADEEHAKLLNEMSQLKEKLAKVEAEKVCLENEKAQLAAERVENHASMAFYDNNARVSLEADDIVEEVVEVEEKPKKQIDPSYQAMVAYASTLVGKEIKVVENANQTQHKFYLGKKLYLVMQDTNHDYRISFLASEKDALKLIVDYPGIVVKAKAPVGPNWFKLTNKGDMNEKWMCSIIEKSVKVLEDLEASELVAKAALKVKAQKAKEAEKAKARKAALKAKASKARKQADKSSNK